MKTSPGGVEFTVLFGRQRLSAAQTLAEALDIFRTKLALVPVAG